MPGWGARCDEESESRRNHSYHVSNLRFTQPACRSRQLLCQGGAWQDELQLYYYNLACADAEEGKLADARKHLQQAFARKANVIPGETMPDPTKDDSFLPYRSNKDFWAFIENLH
jgi:hypothetical protein